MSILKELDELISNQIITKETAQNIESYFNLKKSNSSNKLFIVFGILGAILVGLGIILILAHNWDNLSTPIKTTLAFFPLVIGQIICGYTLLKKPESITWRESSSAFLFFAVGSSMALISQIYNIPGNISTFTLTWMLLCLPLVYLLNSSVTSLLYLIGITYYACEIGYWGYPREESITYWLLLIGILPHYYKLFTKRPESNFMIFHSWFIPLSITICLGTVAINYSELLFIAYFSLFGIFSFLGDSSFFQNKNLRNNSYKIIGSLGTIIALLIVSFNWYWEDLINLDLQFNSINDFAEIIASIILSSVALWLFIKHFKSSYFKKNTLIEIVFIIFILTFLIGLANSVLPKIIINLLIFGIGILNIRKGTQQNHLGILNYGLLIITTLVICRFFDTDLSFVLRGLLFVAVGIGFFAANYWLLKKRKTNEK